ncbi:Response regulator receiver domain-containing protein [Arboricoccus pini]|uniref:Response regulator receiver domain-containing protein n=1 Tax=Arboricoccus pini TaxID=1963835 RepID=A0A212R1W5_9PROT|nr:response regulator [Arboricoccus pini]SNB66003.1 Response regulator receiver domain-containing protein [Arboricoccus pini]
MCVLVVEDEWLIRSLLVEILSEHGFEVSEASSADEAVDLVRRANDGKSRFSLLVSDINLPGGQDGFGVAAAFRRNYPGAPIVFVTGRPHTIGDFPERLPSDILLMKPFRPSQLLKIVTSLIGRPEADPLARH